MVQEFLELRSSFVSLVQLQIRQPAHVDGIKRCAEHGVRVGTSELIGARDLKYLDGFRRAFAIDFDGGTDCGEKVPVDHRVKRVLLLQLVCPLLCPVGVPGPRQSKSRQNLDRPCGSQGPSCSRRTAGLGGSAELRLTSYC